MLCLLEVWAVGRSGVWGSLLFCSLFPSSSLCSPLDLWVMLSSGSGDWLDKLTWLRMWKIKSILVFFYQIVSLFHLPTWLHNCYHPCSKVVPRLSAAPSGDGRLNWPCKCSPGRWLCWGLQCTLHALGLLMSGLFQIFCFSAVCWVEDRLCSFSPHYWEQVILERK